MNSLKLPIHEIENASAAGWAVAAGALGVGLLLALFAVFAIGRLKRPTRHWYAQRRASFRRVLGIWCGLLVLAALGNAIPFPGGVVAAGRPFYLVGRMAVFAALLLGALLLSLRLIVRRPRRLWQAVGVGVLLAAAVFTYPCQYSFDLAGCGRILLVSGSSAVQAVRYAAFPWPGAWGIATSILLASLLASAHDPAPALLPVRARRHCRWIAACLYVAILVMHVTDANSRVWKVVNGSWSNRLPAAVGAIEDEDTDRLLRYAAVADSPSWLIATIRHTVANGQPVQFSRCGRLAVEKQYPGCFETVLELSPLVGWGTAPDHIAALEDLLMVAVQRDRRNGGAGSLRRLVQIYSSIGDPADRMAALATCATVALKTGDKALAERCVRSAMESSLEFPWIESTAHQAVLSRLLSCVIRLRGPSEGRRRFVETVEKLKGIAERGDRVAALAIASTVAVAAGYDDLSQEYFREALRDSDQFPWGRSAAHRSALERLLEGVVHCEKKEDVDRYLDDAFQYFTETISLPDRLAAMAVLAKYAPFGSKPELRDRCLDDLFEKANTIEDQADRDRAVGVVFEVAANDANRSSYLQAVTRASRKLWLAEDRVQALLRCAQTAWQCGDSALARSILQTACEEAPEMRYEPLKKKVLEDCRLLAQNLGQDELVDRISREQRQ